MCLPDKRTIAIGGDHIVVDVGGAADGDRVQVAVPAAKSVQKVKKHKFQKNIFGISFFSSFS